MVNHKKNMQKQLNELITKLIQLVKERKPLKKISGCFAIVMLVCLALVNESSAASFTALDYPGAIFTAATDINSGGDICGVFIDTSGVFHGFLLSAGNLTPLSVPGAAFTAALGINRQGDIVGKFSRTYPDPLGGNGKDMHGFLFHAGNYSVIDVPGTAWTRAIGINAAGDVVGTCSDVNNGKEHGFLYRQGSFAIIDVPGAIETGTWKINDFGEIAGRFRSGGNEKYHIFQLFKNVITVLNDFPGAAQTAPTAFCGFHSGQNDLGEIVSVYSDGSGNSTLSVSFNVTSMERTHGFLESEGSYTPIDYPSAVGTVAWGINNDGVIAGAYQDNNGRIHGFVRTP